MTEPHATAKQTKQAIGEARTVLSLLPVWVQAVLFLGLAIVCAAAGTLDDWLRVALAILFVGLALTLAAEGIAGLSAHRAAEGASAQPPSSVTPLPTDAG